jgi:hypothetical protein
MSIKRLFDDGKIYQRYYPKQTKELAEQEAKRISSMTDSKEDTPERDIEIPKTICRIEPGEFNDKPVWWIWMRFIPTSGTYTNFDSNTKGLIKALDSHEESSDLLKKTLDDSEVVTLPDGRKWRNVSKRYPYDVSDLRSGIRLDRADIKEFTVMNLFFGTDEQLEQEDWKDAYGRAVKRFPRLLKGDIKL